MARLRRSKEHHPIISSTWWDFPNLLTPYFRFQACPEIPSTCRSRTATGTATASSAPGARRPSWVRASSWTGKTYSALSASTEGPGIEGSMDGRMDRREGREGWMDGWTRMKRRRRRKWRHHLATAP